MIKIILIVVLLTFMITGLMAIKARIGRKGTEEFAALIQQYSSTETEFVLLEVCTLVEFQQGHIEGASHLDFYGKGFKAELCKLQEDLSFLIYCRSGNRSGQSLRVMQELDFNNVQDLTAGINSWLVIGKRTGEVI